MKLAELRKYLASQLGSYEDFPFDDKTMVIKVQEKMFALISLESSPLRISLKCDPFLAENLRNQFSSISAGYHLNKRHWNTIILDDSIPQKTIREMIDHSYQLVFDKLTRKKKAEIENISL